MHTYIDEPIIKSKNRSGFEDFRSCNALVEEVLNDLKQGVSVQGVEMESGKLVVMILNSLYHRYK